MSSINAILHILGIRFFSENGITKHIVSANDTITLTSPNKTHQSAVYLQRSTNQIFQSFPILVVFFFINSSTKTNKKKIRMVYLEGDEKIKLLNYISNIPDFEATHKKKYS